MNSEYTAINTKDLTLKDFNHSIVEGYIGNIHLITLEVPKIYVEKTEPGPLFAFNIRDHDLYEFFLGVKRGRVIDFYGDKVHLSIELGSEYLGINLSDLRKVKNADLLAPNTSNT